MSPGNEPTELPVGEYVAQVESALGRLSPQYRRFFLEEILPLWVEQLSEGLDPRMTLYASAVKSAVAEANKPVNQKRLADSLDMGTVDSRFPHPRNALDLEGVRAVLAEGQRVKPGSRGHFLQENLAPALGTLTGGLSGDDLTYAQAVVAAVNPERVSQRLAGHPVWNPPTPVREAAVTSRYGNLGRVVPASAPAANPAGAPGFPGAGAAARGTGAGRRRLNWRSGPS